MSEFDIKIGTQLDTSKALQELMDFVKKYSGKESISIDIGQVKGASSIKNTTKALQDMQKIAKEIGNTKIDVSKMLGSTTDSVAKGLDKTVGDTAKRLSIAVDRTRRDLVSDATKGIANTTKSLNNEIKDIERSIGRLAGNFNSAKKMQFIDKDSIEKGLSDLNKMGKMKIDISNMNEVKQKISNLGKFLDKTIREANNTAWKENVGSAKINGLLENLKSVQSVMSAKNMDTSGIDDLVDRTSKLMSLPIGELVQQYAQIRKEFSKELVIPLSVKGVINAETAVKSILSYKDDLVKQIAIETDNTKVKQLQEIVQQIDDTVVKLNADLGTVGRSTVKNLIDSSNEKTADNLAKKYDELGNKIEKLNNPKNLTFVKLDDLTNIKKSYEDIGKVVNDVNFNKLDGSKINEVANDISNLKRIVEDTSESAKKLSIKAQIDVGFKNAEQMLLGMESALVKTGKRTGVLNELKKGLQEAMNTFKLDPSKGLSSLNDAIKAIGDQAIKSGLKNITGGLQQYEKYINDYTSLMKKASNTKDLGLAKTYEQEANRTLKALNILEKGMSQSQIGTVNALKFEAQTKASEEFSNSILKTASAVSSYKKELQGINKEVGFDKLVSQAGEKARQEYEGLIDSTNKMQSKLSKMLSSDKVDTGGLAKLNAELKENKSNLDKFKNTSINIKCKEAIADLKELRKEEEKLGHNVSGIDSNIKRIGELQSQLSKGLIGSSQVSKEIDAIEKEHSSMAKLTKKVNDAQKEYKKLVDTVSGLKQNGKLENSVFNSLDKQAESLKGKFTNLNFGTLTAVEVSKITGAVEKFASSVNNAKATDLHLRLKADFDIDASKANVKINGLESALLANGEDTKVVKSLRNKLKKYIETAIDDPALASKGVAGLLDNIANVTASKDLGKITGDLAQYKKYISEIESLSSKASKTTDEALAKKYQNQDKALRSALAKLESGFDEKTLKTATTLRDNAFDGISDNIAKEVDKVKDKINEYRATMENATKGYDVGKFTSNIGKGLAEQFDQGISKADELEAKLNEILSSKNVDVSALAKIRNEIENLQKSTSGFKTSIADTAIRESFDNIQIPNLNNMLQAVKDIMSAKNIDTSGIDKLIAKTKDLANVDVSKLSSEFKAIQDELSKEIKIRLGETGIKSIEDVLEVVLKYKRELEKNISVETDDSKVKQLNNELEKTNKIINSLGGQTGSLGQALISQSDVKNIENLDKSLKKVNKEYESLEKRIDSLDSKDKNLVDISELRNIQEISNDIKKSLGSMTDNLDANKISKVTSEIEKLDQAVTHAEKTSKNIELDIKFNNASEEVESMINGIESAFIKAGKSASGADGFKSQFESIKQSAKTNVESAIAMLNKLKEAMRQTAKNEGLGDISGSFSQYQKYIKEWQQAKLGAIKSSGTDEAKGYEQTASRIENANKRLIQSFKEAQRESANTFKTDSFNDFSSKVNKEINSVENSINKFQSSMKNLDKIVDFKNLSGDVGKGLAEEFNSIMNKAEELRSKLKSLELAPDVDLSEINKVKDELRDLENQADQLKKVSIMLKCSDSISELDKLESKVKEIGNSADGIDELRNKFLTLGSGIREGTADIEGAVKELNNLTNQADKLGKSFEKSFSESGGNFGTKIEGFFQSIKDSFSQFTIGELMADSIQDGVYAVKDIIMELDSAFADFARVAPDNFTVNTANLEQVASTAKQIAIDVGQSTADVITGMSTALQAGAKTMEQATAIAKQSAIFQNVTDMSAEQASKAVATMVNQYFGMDKALAQVDKGVGASVKGYDNLTQAMDLANYAGNNFAISSEGVTQALSRGGSVLSNYGVSLSDSVALISSANESIQDPQRVGNGLKTIAINLAGMKTNAKTGAMELNKTAMALKDIAGIDVFTDESKTQTKDMMTLMNEIKGKWGELNDAQQKALSEGIAGKTQAQVFQSLMNSWSRVKEFQDAYNKGWTIGSAQRENEIYLDSIAGKWNTLRETMTKSISTVGVRDAIKDILDMATKAVEAVNNISNAFGKFGTIGIGVGIASFVKQMASFSKIDWSTFKVIPSVISAPFKAIGLMMDTFETAGFVGGIKSLAGGFKEVVASSGLAKTALVGLKAVLTGIGWGIAIAGVVALGKALYDNAHATEQFVAQSKEQQDVIRDNMTTMSSTKSSLSEIASEYDKLASKTNKTAEELQRFSELKKQIAEISPDLVAGYDSAGDPILKLNGSLTNYIGDLDVAIQKQQQLYNQKTAEQAYAYASENDKNKGNSVANKYNSAKSNVENQIKETVGLRKSMFKEVTGLGIKSAKEMADAGIKYEKEFNDKVIARRKELAETSAKYQEQNLAMQSSALTKLNKNEDAMIALRNSKATDSFQKMMTKMDWGSFNTTQLSSMERGMQKLAMVSKGTVDGMGEVANKTKDVNNAFKENHNVEKWGQALQQCAKTSGSFDTTSWGNYLAEVNAQYEEGAISAEQYNQYLTHMAQTISDLTGMDMSTVLQSLTGSGDAEARLDALSSGLNNFLSAYNKTATDIRNGDSMAIALEKQFNSLKSFGSELRTQVSMTGEVDVDWLINQKEDLPQQMQTMIEAVTADNKVTEVEQELLMTCEMQIENQGKLNDDLANQLQGIFDGTIDISNGVEIAGIKFNAEEAQQLKEALAGCADEAGNLNIKDLGIDKMANDAKKLEAVMKSIGSKKLRLEFEKAGIKDNVNEVNSLKEALKSIPEKKQLDFVAECGSFFNNVDSVEQGINKIPPEKRLKFDIGVDGNEELEDARAKLENMPEEIRTLVYNETIGIENLDMVEDLLSKVDGKTATAILSIDGIQEVFNEAESVEDFLEILTTEEWETKISANCENADEIIKTLEGALEELTGKDQEVTVKTKKEEETVKKEKKEKEEKTTKKETLETEAKTEGVEEAKKQVDDLKHSLEQGIHGEMTLEFKGEDKVEAVIKDKERLEVEGKAITDVQLNNGEKYAVAINEKGQLEVNGVAQTNIDISGAEKLTIAQNEKGQLEVNGQAVTNLDVTGTEKLREANEYVKLLETDAHGNVTITVNGKEEIFATVNEKGKLEADGRALTYVQIDGGEKYAIAVNEKGQLEVNGKALTDIDISGAEKLTLTKNEKGELEVNGQAVTDVMVHGAEKAKTAKKDVEELQKTDGKKVSVNIDISLKETVGEILSRLGLNKKTEKVELKVTCTDEATPKINKILQNNNKPVTFKMNADSANVDNTVKKVRDLGANPISITLKCNADQVTTAIQNISSITSKPFTFNVTAPGASEAYNSISKIQNIQASPKSFTVTAPGSSDAYNAVLRIKNCTIGNKRFTVTAPGSRDAYNAVVKIKNTNIPPKRFTITAPGSAGVISALSTIKSKLDSIHGKAVRVSVTTVYKTVGKPSKEAGGSSANEPEIIKLAKPSFGSGATTQALSGTTQALSGEIQAINNNAETLNNAVSTTSNSAELMASKKVKANIDTSKTIDAVKRNIDLLTNMSNLLSKLATQIDTLQAKQQRTWGSGTIKLLKQQISLLTKQQSLTKVNIKNMEGMSKKLKSSLKKQGFKFKDDGTISNYNSKLLAMEKNVERLEKKEEKYNKKHKDTSKLSKKKQKAVDKQQEANSKATEKARKKLDETKQKLQEYYDLQFSKLPNAKKDWEEYANAIADAKAEIIKADREAKTFFENAKEERLNFQIDKSSTKADTYMTKSDMAKSWKESIKWINKANKELEKNKKRQKEIEKTAKSRVKDNKKILSKQGFKFNSDGSIKGAEKKLESLRKKLSTQEYEAIKEAYDEYMQDIYETIPKAEEEWYKLREEIEENKKSIEETNKAMQELVDNSALTQLTGKYDRLSDTLDLVNAKMEQAHGKHKLSYMQGQMNLLERMDAEQKKMVKENQDLAKTSKKKLSKMGINFTADGDITNLETIMKNLKKNGTLEDMEKLQEEVDKYNDALKNVRDGNKTIADNENSINDLKDSMLELNKELDDMKVEAWATEFDNDIKVIQNRLDKLDAQLDLSNGNQLDLLNEKIKAYEELAKATENSLNNKLSRKGVLSTKLETYGFQINDDGTIDNTAEQLEKLKNSLSDTEFDVVNDYLQEYFNVALDEIPELEKQLLEYQKDLKDVEREKLETTKKIEDEITKVYEKQIEERIDKINEEKDAQVKALNEAKDAYNRYRDEVDYKDDYNKQLKTVEDLQKKIEIAKRDDSLTGQKRLADLMNQLQEEQENLEKMVQDKIDEDINTMFDDQIDKVETDAENTVKNIEDTWTESKIAEMVEQALNTGIFTDIDGNIKSLDTALLEFANNSSEYFGVMGTSLKTELLDNLNIALGTMKELNKMTVDTSSMMVDWGKVNNVSNMVNGTLGSINYIPPSNASIPEINIGGSNIVVQGNADDEVIAKIDDLLKENNKKIYATIMKNVK